MPAKRTQTKAEGKVLGRPSITTPEQRAAMVDASAGKQSVSALARLYGVSRAIVLAVVKSALLPGDDVSGQSGCDASDITA